MCPGLLDVSAGHRISGCRQLGLLTGMGVVRAVKMMLGGNGPASANPCQLSAPDTALQMRRIVGGIGPVVTLLTIVELSS